ncbi:MAG TPA: OmpH family outer membrane protein [Terracidiphilus sp.]|nr:OmpH family outer membrane protein [Terracidiphilus sp.]
MKRVHLALISFALGSALTASAQTTPAAPKPATPAAHEAAPAPGPAKVAVIEFQAAVAQTNEFQRDFADLQKKYDPKRQQIKSLSDDIDNLTKQLQAQSAQLSDVERETRARTIDDKKKQLDRDTQDAQSDFQTDMQELVNRIAGKVGAAMTDYAQKHGYTLVLDATEQQQQAPTVLYALPSIDITKAVIEAYNEKSGIPAPPAPAAATPDAPKPSTSH